MSRSEDKNGHWAKLRQLAREVDAELEALRLPLYTEFRQHAGALVKRVADMPSHERAELAVDWMAAAIQCVCPRTASESDSDFAWARRAMRKQSDEQQVNDSRTIIVRLEGGEVAK